MSELKPCPFGADHKVWIGVHDEEGNYHGTIGCEYESDPWSGLSYGLHHDGWGDCTLCTDGEVDCMGGMLFDTPEDATEAWNTRVERTCKPFTRQRQPCSNCGAFVSLDAAMDCIATLPVRHCPLCGAKVVGHD